MADVLLAATLQGDSAVSAAVRREVVFQNAGSGYKRPVTIDNTGNANILTDYQVLVTLDTASLIAAGKMRSDCGDIRFRDSDDQTELPYWIESGANTTSTKIWVKVPSIPGSSTKTIFLQYGDLNLQSQSSGALTMEFFDDASGVYSDKWVNIEGTGSYAVVGGKQAISLNSVTTNIRTKDYQSSGPIAIEADLYATALITAIQYYQDSTPTTNERYHARIDIRPTAANVGWEAILKDGAFPPSYSDKFGSASTWINCKLTRDQNGNHNWYVGGQLASSRSADTTYTSGYLVLNHHNVGTGAVANLRVRKYTSPEPTTAVGAETAIAQKLTLSGGSSLSARASVERALATLLQGDSTFTPHGLYTLLEATLQGDSQLTANVHLIAALKALLQGDSSLTAQAARERLLQVLLKGDSSLTAEMHTAVVILVLNYLLSVADQLNYKLSAKDLADFKLKVADLANYVLKMGGGSS